MSSKATVLNNWEKNVQVVNGKTRGLSKFRFLKDQIRKICLSTY